MSNDLDALFGSSVCETQPVEAVECPPPGVYYNVPAHIYHRWGCIASTFLKGYASLPSTCREPWVPGDDGAVGSAIHAYSLQGAACLAEECFILPPECEGTSKAAKQLRAELEVCHPSKCLLPHRYGPGAAEKKVPIMEILDGVDASLHAHPKIGPVLKRAKKEVSLVWIDAGTGLTCKARLDIWDEECLTIWDLKKTRKGLKAFSYQINDLFYRLQAGHYFNGAVACGLNPVVFGFVPVEASPPYQVGCGYIQLEPINKLEEAAYDAQRMIGLLKESIASDYWPNFPPPGHIYSWEDMTPDDLVTIY